MLRYFSSMMSLNWSSCQETPVSAKGIRHVFTHLRPKHPQNLAALIVDNGLRLDVIQNRHGKPPLVLGIHGKVNVPQVREPLVTGHRIGDDILPSGVCVLGRCEAPAYSPTSQHPIRCPCLAQTHIERRLTVRTHMPMHSRERNNILQPLELSRNERTRSLHTLMSTKPPPPSLQNVLVCNSPTDKRSSQTGDSGPSPAETGRRAHARSSCGTSSAGACTRPRCRRA